MAALGHLGRHLGLFTDRVEHTVDLDLARGIQAARERARALREAEAGVNGERAGD